jgi:excisionase family DNA binding protein
MSLPPGALAGTLPGGAEREYELHARFGGSRIPGSEWFEITPELEALLAILTIPAWVQGEAGQVDRVPDPAAEVPQRLLHDAAEAAILLGISEAEVWQLIAARKLPFIRLPGRRDTVRIEREVIDSYWATSPY